MLKNNADKIGKSRGARALFAMVIYASDYLSFYGIGMGKFGVM
jgi:hypothetical protein